MKVTNHPAAGADNLTAVEKSKSTPRVTESTDAKARPEATAPTSSTTVELSESARMMREATEAVKAAPSLDPDKVERLKEAIRNGTYRVDAEAVAERILDEHFRNHFGKNDL